jgi:hypothetical protein
VTETRNIADELTSGGVKLNLGGSIHDPNDPMGRLLFNALVMVADRGHRGHRRPKNSKRT